MEKPWIEEYRPNDIDDIIINNNVRQQIENIILSDECKHIIISGLPGVGKTSTVKCLAKKILGKHASNMILELNTTEEKYMKNIPTTLNTFCRTVTPNDDLKKIIILDEADLITSKAQNDLSNKMKEFGDRVHFFFTCNDSTKIIENIQSMCRIIHYPLLTKEQIIMMLEKICKLENLEYTKKSLGVIYDIAQGDLRKGINNLQLVANTGKINEKNIYKICTFPDPDEIIEIIENCKKKDIESLTKNIDNLILNGYNYQDILNCFAKVFIDNKMNIIYLELIHSTKIITVSLKTKLQLYSLCFKIYKLINNDKL